MGEGGGCDEASKPQLQHEPALSSAFELAFAGPVKIGSTKGKACIKVCSFMGLDFFVTPPTAGITNSTGSMPVAAWCVQTCKEKDANLELIKTTSMKKFNLKTWEFVSPRPTLKRKHSGDEDGPHSIDVEVSFPVLKCKANHEGKSGVVLAVNATSVICQSPSAEILTPVEAKLKEISDAKEQADDLHETPSKNKAKAKGGTWSTKHLLR